MVLDKNWQFFHLFISAKKWRDNLFDDILEEEHTFVDNKNNKLIKSKNCDFSKGVSPWFLVKNCEFFEIFIKAKKG